MVVPPLGFGVRFGRAGPRFARARGSSCRSSPSRWSCARFRGRRGQRDFRGGAGAGERFDRRRGSQRARRGAWSESAWVVGGGRWHLRDRDDSGRGLARCGLGERGVGRRGGPQHEHGRDREHGRGRAPAGPAAVEAAGYGGAALQAPVLAVIERRAAVGAGARGLRRRRVGSGGEGAPGPRGRTRSRTPQGRRRPRTAGALTRAPPSDRRATEGSHL